MTIVSCLGSRPQRLLESAAPSPGEIRKLRLALGMAREPHVIVMDEPTNHMDLPSIECLEQALADCPCALVLVSHDKRFLDKLVRTRWHFSPAGRDMLCVNPGFVKTRLAFNDIRVCFKKDKGPSKMFGSGAPDPMAFALAP